MKKILCYGSIKDTKIVYYFLLIYYRDILVYIILDVMNSEKLSLSKKKHFYPQSF